MATTPSSNISDRRTILASAGAMFLAAAATTANPQVAMAAAMETEDFSNDFIQTLKARSDGKRDDYTKQNQDSNTTWKKLNTAKFSSQYDRPTFVGVQRADKTFQMVTPEQLEVLKKEGKVYFEYETKLDKKGNEYIDYAQGEILKFSTSVE
jgi:hypothetical protein